MRSKENFEILLIRRVKLIITNYWRHALLFVFLTTLSSLTHHKLFPRFKAVSVLYVKTAQDSSLQNIVGKASGVQMNPYSIDPPSAKYIKVLKSDEFLNFIEKELEDEGYFNNKIKEVAGYYTISAAEGWNKKLASTLLGTSTFKGNDDLIEIHSNGTTLNRVVTTSQILLDLCIKYITNYERKEILEAETYLRGQQVLIQNKIDQMNEQIDKIKGDQYFSEAGGIDTNLLGKSLLKLKEEEQITKYRIEETERNIRSSLHVMNGEIQGDENFDDDNSTEPIIVKQIYRMLKRKRGLLPDRIRQYLEDYRSLKSRLKTISNRVDKIKKSINPKAEQQIFNLKQKIDVENTFYQQLQKQIFENRIYQISIDNRVQPYSIANYLNAGRETPFIYKFFVTSLLSLIFFFLAAVIYLKIHPTVNHKDDLLNLGINYLGMIPDMSLPTYGFRSLFGLKENLPNTTKLHNPAIRSYIATCFQILGASVIQSLNAITKNRKGVISILSHSSGDGKTIILTNLAIYFGHYGFKTLLIQADWLKAHNNSLFENNSANGLVEYLSGKTDNVDDIIMRTTFKNVSVIGPGSEHHTLQFFKESKYSDMIKKLRSRYDIILIDTPALQAGVEAIELSLESDFSILLTRLNKTKIEKLRELIDRASARGVQQIYGLVNFSESDQNAHDNYRHAYIVSEGGKRAQ